MKKTMLAFALVCLLAAGAVAQVKVIQCSPACNMSRKKVEKHAHVVHHILKQSPESLAKGALLYSFYVLRHPVRTLKDVF